MTLYFTAHNCISFYSTAAHDIKSAVLKGANIDVVACYKDQLLDPAFVLCQGPLPPFVVYGNVPYLTYPV